MAEIEVGVFNQFVSLSSNEIKDHDNCRIRRLATNRSLLVKYIINQIKSNQIKSNQSGPFER